MLCSVVMLEELQMKTRFKGKITQGEYQTFWISDHVGIELKVMTDEVLLSNQRHLKRCL